MHLFSREINLPLPLPTSRNVAYSTSVEMLALATPFKVFFFFLTCAKILGQCLACDESPPSKIWFHLNGYTQHFDAPNTNSALFGVGFTWYQKPYHRILNGWEGDVFQDSARKPSGYLGYSGTIPFRIIGVGATVAIMYHRNFIDEDRWRILPVVLPFLEKGGEFFKVRLYYIPPVRRRYDQQVSLQLMTAL